MRRLSLIGLIAGLIAATSAARAADWAPPSVDKLPNDAWGEMVRFGQKLTNETYGIIGPEVADAGKRYAGNNLSCQNCHLDGGAKEFGLPFVGVFGDFPQYRSREGQVGTIEDRVNGCMTRSMNGRELPPDSREMKAFVAYIKFLSTGRPVGAATPGRGAGAMPELTRAADPKAGAAAYVENCAVCHGEDGQGKRRGASGDAAGYEFPPLWGPDSFNNGAGMNRLISAANFIHANMPFGVTLAHPQLTTEQAWDIGAFIVSRDRPQKAGLDRDFPVRKEKPVDAGYGPYIDSAPPEQHKFGPFTPIRDALKAAK